MSVSINTNANAQFAAVAVQRANEMMDEAMLRLSTGKRLNSAKDDAAGIQVAIRMEKELNGITQALRNANDAQGLVDTGEAALKEVSTLLLRMREIAVSASSDTNTDAETAKNAHVGFIFCEYGHGCIYKLANGESANFKIETFSDLISIYEDKT